MDKTRYQGTQPYIAPVNRSNVQSFQQKTHNPDQLINNEIIAGLFLKIAEADISQIKNYISTNNVNLTVRDDNSNSVLHNIIKNGDITKNEKIEIIEYLINNGAPVMAYNNENMTPLHLASKYQMKEIVELLIKSGADVNSIDNVGMTPLYHAIQGLDTDCNLIRNEKMDSLFTKPDENKVQNSDILKLNSIISDFMYKDNIVSMYLKHIKNTISDYKNIYAEDYREIKNKYDKDINNILSDMTTSDKTKRDKIEQTIYSIKLSIEKSIKSKIEKSLKNENINVNNKYAFFTGSRDIAENKIFETTPDKIYSDNIHEQNVKMSNNMREMILNNKFNTLASFVNMRNTLFSSKSLLENLYWYEAGFRINTGINFRMEITQLIQINPATINLYEIALDNQIVQIDLTQNNNVTADIFVDQNPVPILVKRGRANDTKKYNYNAYDITKDMGLVGRVQISGKVLDPTRLGPALLNIIPLRYTHTFMTESLYMINRLGIYRNTIVNNNDVILDHINNGIYLFIPYLISLNMTYIINSYLYLYLLNEQMERVKATLYQLRDLFESKVQQYNNDQFVFYIDQGLDDINNHIKKIEEINLNGYYTNLTKMILTQNTIIDFINQMSYSEYVREFNNNFSINYVNNMLSNDFVNIFTRKIPHLDVPKDTFAKFVEKIKQMDDGTQLGYEEIKLYMAEKYIMQIEQLTTYIIDYAIIPLQVGNIINNLQNFQFLEYDNTTGDVTPLPITLTINRDNVGNVGFLYIGSDINPNGVQLNFNINFPNQKPKTKLTNKTEYARFGTNDKYNSQKEHESLPIISHDLDSHFLIIKYTLLYYISEQILSNLAYKQEMKKSETYKFIRQYLKNTNNLGPLITINAKLIDNIVTSYINGIIDISSTVVAKNTINDKNYSKILGKIIGNNNEVILNNDYGYGLKLNEIVNSITSINKSNINKNIVSIIEERPKIKQNVIEKYNYNYKQTNNRECKILDLDIINYLIKNGSSVHVKDFSGNTVLHYAISLENPEIVNLLINNSANANINNSQNKYGMTPLQMIIKEIFNESGNNGRFADNYYENIKKLLEINAIYKNITLNYSSSFLPQLLIMLNHYFFIQAKNYPRNWTFNKMQNLSEIISADRNSIIDPYLSFGNLFIPNNELNVKYNYVNKEIININNEIDELNNKLINYQNEMNTLGNNYPDRKTDLNKLLIKNTNKIMDLQNEKNKLIGQIQNVPKQPIKNNLATDKTNVMDIYNNIYWQFNKNKKYDSAFDVNYFPNEMQTYISSNPYTFLQIHTMVQDAVLYSIRDINKDNVSNIMVKLNIIIDFYDNVLLPMSQDYVELPLEYNEKSNYVLYNVMNILIFTLKTTLMIPFYNTIVKSLAKYVRELNLPPSREIDEKNISISNKYNENEYAQYISEILIKIIDAKPESQLMKYIFDYMPEKIIKLQLNIFSDDNDSDKLLNKDIIYEQINKILMSNSVIPINENSSIIKNISNDVIPFYKSYIDMFIDEGYKMINNYFAYIRHEANLLKILRLLIQQGMRENSL